MELNIDQYRFLKKYFLGPDGKLDRTKTPHPMVLVGLDDPVVLWDTDGIEELQMKIALQGSRNILVLGWSEEKVSSVVSILESRQGDDKYSPERNLAAKDLAKYQDTLSTSLDSGHSLPRGAEGHYRVRSTEIEALAQINNMRLAIAKIDEQGWMAAFDFNVLEGLMILDTNIPRLDARWVKGKTSNCRVMEWESDSGSNQSDSEDELTVPAQKQDIVICNPLIPRLEASPSRKQKRSLTSPSEKPPKRRKICEKDYSRLLFFRWYTVDHKGSVQVGANGNQKGRLEFVDEGCTKFEGTLSGSSMGHKVSFQGFKLTHEVASPELLFTGNNFNEAEDDW